MRTPWTPAEIKYFLKLNADGIPADGIACGLGNRSKSAVQGMRRTLKRLQDLGAGSTEIPKLLTVSNAFVETHTLMQVRTRAALDVIPTKGSLRRARYSGKPHLVGAYNRNRATP